MDSSYTFQGIIWNTLADGEHHRLYLEVRDPATRKVAFSALNLRNNQWLWKDLAFDEPWWISLRAVSGDILLLNVYTDTNNPDKKSLIAYHVLDKKIIWWQNDFSCTAVNALYVRGLDQKFSGKETLLDVFTGKPVAAVDFDLAGAQNFPVIRPFQYEEGSAHFDTVRQFLQTRMGIAPVATIDYLEYDQLIILSVFLKNEGLANYLYGFDADGKLLIEEKLGEKLKGVGMDTFFIFLQHLIFVKNKNELRTYKIL